jgi:glycogen synthase
VVTEHVAASDLVREQAAGLVVPAEIPALASALGRLLADAPGRAQCGENARRFASQNFSRAKLGVALRRYYGQIISERKAAA